MKLLAGWPGPSPPPRACESIRLAVSLRTFLRRGPLHDDSRCEFANYPRVWLERRPGHRLDRAPVCTYCHRRTTDAVPRPEPHQNFSIHTAFAAGLDGYAGDFLLSHSGSAFRHLAISRRWRIAFCFPAGTRVARGSNLVRDSADRACASYAGGKGN